MVESSKLSAQNSVASAVPKRPPPPGLSKIAEAVEARLDEMIERALEAILVEVPVYSQRGPDIAGDTRRAAAYVYVSFLEMIRTGQPPNEAVARSLATVGADRAMQGIPLADLLQGFRISARSAAEMIDRVVREQDIDRDAAMWAMESLVAWIDLVSNLSSRDYTRTQARILHESEERRRGFLLDLLYGGIAGDAALGRAEEVGWDPAADYWVGIFGSGHGTEPAADVRERAASVFELGFIARTRGDLVVLLPLRADDDLDTVDDAALGIATAFEIHVGLTRPRSGIDGVRRAYLEAEEALEIARALDVRSVRYEDAVLDRILLRDPDLLAELVEQTVAPLREYDRARSTELTETLETYLDANASPSRTASALHTHPQTVRYRLSRIEDITGLHMDTAEGRLLILLGLRAQRLLQTYPTRSDVTMPR
ncbi:MAG: helix-turn-helix domain-containing protein [Acidimicrobiia bacterium]|nr:helix-turn-helix domain-containing protein [Acidimicrobiia bacterium]